MRGSITLTPLCDVEACGSGFRALSSEPWLALDAPALLACAGRFAEVTYRASLWDEPVRPVFRFETAAKTTVERIAPGPVAGAGIWIGRVPAGTVRVSVSPTGQPGFFGFRVETVRRRSWFALLRLGFRQHPRSTRSALLTRLIGWGPEADNNLAWAIGSTRMVDYGRWRAARARSADLDGLDAPRCDWATASPIHLYIDARGTTSGLQETLDALKAQIFPRWTALVIGAAPKAAADDPRISFIEALAPVRDAAGFVAVLRPGDCLLAHALACVAETAARHPACRLIYGDEEWTSDDGVRPAFKPGWSPLLQQHSPYFGRALFVRGGVATADRQGEALRDAPIPQEAWLGLDRGACLALRRVVLRRAAAPPAPSLPSPVIGRSLASVAVVIPTRDQANRLRRAIDSIRRCSAPRQPLIVVVDNGSIEAETLGFLDDLRRSGEASVIQHPGAFNFSAMCNEGAMAAGAVDVLVFLNDDTQVLTAGWLDRLTHWAQQPLLGAVGARLTYPDGRLQHIGVTLGMGGSAGHFGAFASPDEAGWAGRHHSVHEVSAVTGACLAVAREKFASVGGFDAVALPIELSDIDLCLKLGERGWTTVVDPAVHLCHEESVSRGRATFRRLALYEEQRACFLRRWRHVVRDDPYFHPGLSLYRWHAALA